MPEEKRVNLSKVLIADDEPTIRQLLETNLFLEGFTALAASDGREALEKIFSEHPEVVLLDLMMPGMDGWQVLDELRAAAWKPRVIVLSAKAADSSKLKGWLKGCDDYVTKPFDLDDLLGRIHDVQASSAEDISRRRREAIEALEAAAGS